MSTCKHKTPPGRLYLRDWVVTAKAWCWMPGMLLMNGFRVVRVDGNKLSACSVDVDTTRVLHDVESWQYRPDFSDEATMIALEHLVLQVGADLAGVAVTCCRLNVLVTALGGQK